ncbi:hypothetical protein AB0H07_28575 [Streptomyces sp. NPDC021354]|uniref:hypothetical protein n=1 Tax=Streptomyces sp. NPDC021354 TaxID=3154793 RepID=UPI0033F83AE0
MLGVLVEDRAQVSFAGHFAPRTRNWFPNWPTCSSLWPVTSRPRVERGGELAVTIPDEEPEAPSPVAEVHEQIAGELSDPCARRVGGDAQDVNAPGGSLHDEEDVETFEEDGLHVHKIAGQKRVGLGSEEGTPGLLKCALRRGWQAGAAQDAPDRGGGNPMTKAVAGHLGS